MRALLALLLFAGPLLGQAANGWAPIENGWGEVQIPSSTSAPSGLTSGRVTLSTGATTVGDDAGCTWTGTGNSFVLNVGGGVQINTGGFGAGGWASFWGGPDGGVTMGSGNLIGWDSATSHAGYNRTGIDLALSRASVDTLLVEDGSGNARDVRARTVFVGNGSAGTPAFGFSAHAGEGFYFDASSGLSIVSGGSAPLMAFSSGYPGSVMASNAVFSWGDSNARNPDLFLRKSAAAILQLGDIDAASPVSQTLQVQGSRGGTDTNVAGGNLTIRPGAGTGSATGSSIIFQTPTATGSGTTGQTQTTRLTLSEPAVIAAVPVRLKGYTVATLPAGTVGDTAYVTDATAPTYLGALTGGGAVTTPVFYNGAAWVSH